MQLFGKPLYEERKKKIESKNAQTKNNFLHYKLC